MNARVANGKRKFAGKLARTCTIGWAARATRGLRPIQTPIGTHTSVAKTTSTITREKVIAPYPNALRTSPGPSAPM